MWLQSVGRRDDHGEKARVGDELLGDGMVAL